jgi:hypothetical protein
MTKTCTFAALSLVAALAGCSTTDASADAGAATSADGAVSVDAGAPAPPVIITGIPECDDLIARYDACLEKNAELKKKEILVVGARKTSLKLQATTESRDSVLSRCKVLFERPLRSNCPL